MEFTVMDVGHGFCAYVEAHNGELLVFDCGHKSFPEVRPSRDLPHPSNGNRTISRLFITNYDEDHISDLPQLRKNFNINTVHRNKSISTEQLKSLKLQGGPISSAMSECLSLMDEYSIEENNDAIDLQSISSGLSWKVFHNNYGEKFFDTNNISLVTILEMGNIGVLIPGDIEVAGWLSLLKLETFRIALRNVSVFVASHHGRENGYCKEVFDYCSPQIIAISDSAIKHGTQETADKYAQHASGMLFSGKIRYVVSTRKDGTYSFWDS